MSIGTTVNWSANLVVALTFLTPQRPELVRRLENALSASGRALRHRETPHAEMGSPAK